MSVKSLEDILAEVLRSKRRPKVAIAPCAEEFVLRAGVDAFERGVAEPVFVGDIERAEAVAQDAEIDIAPFEKINAPDNAASVYKSVQLYKSGDVSMIMKGLVGTSTLLKAVLNKETGVPPDGIMSHITVFDAPFDDRLMLLTDAGVNIKPNLQRKVDILKNALSVARKLGIYRPRVAMLAATEKVNYPAMPATLDADIISKMSEQGEFGDAIVAGPISLDIAVSKRVAKCKGFASPVGGHADILCASDIESGNILYKSLGALHGSSLASIVVGSRIPVIVPSRGDSELSKFYSITLACYLSGINR